MNDFDTHPHGDVYHIYARDVWLWTFDSHVTETAQWARTVTGHGVIFKGPQE